MTKLLQYLIKDGVVKKSNILEFISNNPDSAINIKELIKASILDKDYLYEYILRKIRDGVFTFNIVDSFVAEGIDTNEFYKYVANKLNIEYIDLNSIEIDSSLFDIVPISFLLKNRAIVVEEDDIYTTIAFADPFDLGAQDAISRFFRDL